MTYNSLAPQDQPESPSDANLLQTMAGPELRLSQQARDESFRRHGAIVVQHLRAAIYEVRSDEDAMSLTFETFERARKRANSFRIDLWSSASDKTALVRAWLRSIADNLLADQGRVARRTAWQLADPSILDRRPGPSWSPHPQNSSRSGPKTMAAWRVRVVGIIGERAFQLLCAYFEYFDRDTQSVRFPDEVRAELCEQHGITSDNLRQICSRALRTLAQHQLQPRGFNGSGDSGEAKDAG